MENNNKQAVFLIRIFIISIAMSMFFFAVSYKQVLSGDADQYDAIGWNLAQGNGYSLSSEPTMLREPVYPFFLASIYTIFGHRVYVVYLIQSLLFSLSCIFVFFIAKETFSEKVAKYSTFLVAVCPTLANSTILLYSESFFFFLLMAGTRYLTKINLEMKIKQFIICGVLLGVLALCKGAMLFLFIPFVIYLYVNNGSLKNFLRAYSLKITLLVLALFLTVAPWLMRNYRLFGIFGLNSISSGVLLARTYRADYPIERSIQATTYYFSEYLGAKIFPNAFNKPRYSMLEEGHRVIKKENELLKRGYSRAEIDNILRKEAISNIRSHPIKFLLMTPLELMRLIPFMHIPFFNQTETINRFNKIKNGDMVLSLIRGIYKITVYPLLFFTIVGLYFNRRNWRKTLFFVSIILYVNFIYSLLSGYPRYNVPLIPFYFMFATIGAMRLLKLRTDK